MYYLAMPGKTIQTHQRCRCQREHNLILLWAILSQTKVLSFPPKQHAIKTIKSINKNINFFAAYGIHTFYFLLEAASFAVDFIGKDPKGTFGN